MKNTTAKLPEELSRTLAGDAVEIAIEVVGIGRQDAESAVGNVGALQIGGRRRDADIGIRGVATWSRGIRHIFIDAGQRF